MTQPVRATRALRNAMESDFEKRFMREVGKSAVVDLIE